MCQISRFIGLTWCFLPAMAVQAAAQVSVGVAPKGTIEPNRTQHTGGYSATFRVINETGGGGSTQFQVTCGGNGLVTCDSIRPTSVTIANGGANEQTVTAYYKVGNDGSGRLYGYATAGAVADTGYRVVPVVPPAGAPRVDFSFWLDSLQPLDRCAANCPPIAYAVAAGRRIPARCP